MRAKQISEEVFFSSDDVVKVTKADIEELKSKADRTQRRKARLCCHPSSEDPLHEMLIVHARGSYVRPHKHLNKSEAFHVIEGRADVVLFSDAGEVIEVIPLGDYDSGKVFYYRLSRDYYHSLLIHSDKLVFHEVKNGPFDKNDALFAPWAPQESELAQSEEFVRKLEQSAKQAI